MIKTVAAYRPDELTQFKLNPRIGNVDVIANSLRANSQYRPVVVNKGTYTGRPLEILKGNHTVQAIQELSERYPDDERWSSVDCWVVDVDEEAARRIVAADNRTADLGSFDEQILLELLQDLPDMDLGTGYSQEDLSAMNEKLREWEPQDNSSSETEGDDEEEGHDWPKIKTRVPPAIYELFVQVPGQDHSEKLQALLRAIEPGS